MTKLLTLKALLALALVATTGCFQTALVAVSVVNAVDSVSDMAERRADKKKEEGEQAGPGGYWVGKSASDLFVAWGQPDAVYQQHENNHYQGLSYLWDKSCNPASPGSENRSANNGPICQIEGHADSNGRIKAITTSPDCALCPDLTKRLRLKKTSAEAG